MNNESEENGKKTLETNSSEPDRLSARVNLDPANPADAEAKGVLTPAECALLERVRDVSFEFISVDDFDTAALQAGRHAKPALRSVA